MPNLCSVLKLDKISLVWSLFVAVFAPVCACRYVCLHCKYADVESRKQIRFVRHVLAHKAAEFGLRVWVVDRRLHSDVGEPKVSASYSST